MKNKKGQLFGQVFGIVGGLIALGLLVAFGYIWFSNLNTPALLPTNSIGSQAINNFTANFTTGVNNVSSNIPTIFSLGIFILIVVLLVLAYAVARKNGLFGGGQIG